MTKYPDVLLKSILLLALLTAGRMLTAGTIPYPSALTNAAVTQPSLANIYQNGLVIGNGELNAIVYTSGNQIRLRVSKNDVWDSRINTSADAALPKINPTTGAYTGSGNQPSWDNYVYPTGLPCIEVVLAAAGGQTAWTGTTLDLTKARAIVNSDVDTSTIRVLAQTNAFHINSLRPLSFIGINQTVADSSGNSISGWVSNVTTGTTNGYSYVRQNIPGDADASGMDVYIVAGSSGTNNVVAVVTSRDSATPLATAVAIVTAMLNDASAVATHESIWQNFWSASGIQLGDTTLQNWWYRMVYYNRCFATAGANVIGLKAGFDQLGGWHNAPKINYNIQQTYCLGGPVNHPEFIQPFVDAIVRNLPRGRWLATNTFVGVSEGAFFHSDWWPFEPDPAVCTTVNRHQQAYLPYGFSWGMQGHMAFNLWEFYKYNPTTNNLNKVWPALSEFGRFYCALLEKCPMSNGKRQLAPSYFPENGGYGQANTCYDIAYINCGLKAAMAAAGLMGDTTLSNRCAANLALMPTYSVTMDNGQTVIEEWLGSGLQGADRHATQVQPVYPADEITWFSSQSDKDLFKRTIARAEWITTHANSTVTINIARARLSLGTDAINNLKLCLASNSSYSPEQPNGLFYWNAHGNYISEQFGVARCVTELLLQSVGDIIRIFPALPANIDGHFAGLLARGGFQVSADQVAGVVSNVTITSTVGGNVSLVSLWSGRTLKITDVATGGEVAYTTNDNIITFGTAAGKTYAFAATPAAPTGLRATQSGGQIMLAWNAATEAVSYYLKRSVTSGGGYVTLTNTSVTNYTDNSVVNGTTYFYVVSATNQIGESADSAPISITLGVGAGTNLIWSGAVNGNWNTATANWLGNGLVATYLDGNAVLFDDNALSNTTVNIAASVSPASVTVNNTAKAYTFSGSAIGGTGSLTKSGTNTLSLNSTETYTGGTTVNGGTLNLNTGGSSGCIRGSVIVNAGGVLQLNTGDAIGYSSGVQVTNVNLNGATLNNTVNANQGYNCTFNLTGGTMNSSGGGAYNFNGSSGGINTLASANVSTISGPITLRASGLVINTASGTAPGGIDLDITGAITEQYGSFNLTKAGPGLVRLQTAATHSGLTVISNGGLQLAGGGGSSGALPNSTITVLGGAELQLNNGDALGYNNSKPLTNAGTVKQVSANSETLYRPIILNGGTITSTSHSVYNEAYNYFGGYIRTLAGTVNAITGVGNFGLRTSSCYFTNDAGSTLTIGCPIQGYLGTGTAPLNKAGAGTLILTAANVYGGNTVISQGTLALGAAGSFAFSPVIRLASNAVLDVTAKAGGLVLAGSQSLFGSGTLAGSLSDGTNSLIAAGSQVYNSPATLNITGDLTLNGRGTLAYDIASTNTPGSGVNDLIAVGGNVNLAGATALMFNFLNGAPATNRPYLLLTNSGARLGGVSNLLVTPNGYAAVLDDSNPHALYVTFTGPGGAAQNTLALTPPMGWNSWNTFACGIDEMLIRQIADVMATNGMKDAGYQYVNLDDCWQTSRDANGVIVADPDKFPSGIKALADYVHSKGLKLGIYSDHGTATCAGRPGSYGYETIDANTYAAWGVDYLKEDNCYLPAGDNAQADYHRMSQALQNSGRPIVLSICAWEFLSWMPTNGHLWRTTGDISASWSSVYSLLSPNSAPAFFAGPGHWNDPDMLEVGNGLTLDEDRSHFTLWCLMAAPLLAGNDVRSASADTLAILTNPEVIAVNQDPAGEQGIRVAGVAGANEIWCKPLGTNFNTKAVALFNASGSSLSITANWTNVGLQAGTAFVRDLWSRTDLGIYTNSFTATIPAHGVRLLKVTGTAPALPSFGTNYLTDLQPAYSYTGWGTMTNNRSIGGAVLTLNGKTYAKGIGTHAYSGVEYYLGGRASRFQADVGVDDEVGANGTVIFQVYADGVKLFDSGVMIGGGAHQTIDLDVTGKNRLTLGVANADDGINSDHADWADARILVTVAAQPQFAPPVVSGSNLVLSGNGGMPNELYRVLTSTNVTLPSSNWTVTDTNRFDGSGAFIFTNTLTPPSRYFRLVSP